MATLKELEERLAALELAVARLQTPSSPALGGKWVEQMVGKFENDPEFEKVVQYGREFRESHPYPEDSNP